MVSPISFARKQVQCCLGSMKKKKKSLAENCLVTMETDTNLSHPKLKTNQILRYCANTIRVSFIYFSRSGYLQITSSRSRGRSHLSKLGRATVLTTKTADLQLGAESIFANRLQPCQEEHQPDRLALRPRLQNHLHPHTILEPRQRRAYLLQRSDYLKMDPQHSSESRYAQRLLTPKKTHLAIANWLYDCERYKRHAAMCHSHH
jgi:hypothetical protein